MILELANQVRWEWFKLRRRWMPYILLAVLVLISQVAIWGTLFAYNDTRGRFDETYVSASPDREGVFVDCDELLETGPSDLSATLQAVHPDITQAEADAAAQQGMIQCQDWDERRREDAQGLYTLITPPGSASFTMSIGQSIGLMLVAILTASLIGTEHGWGTLRFLLVRGVRRWHVLASKLGIAWLAFAAALLVIGVLGTLSGQIIDGLLSGAEGLETSTSWGEVSELFGRSLLSVLPYVAMVSLVTVAARSSAAGIGIGVGYYFLEQTVVGIFSALFDWFQNVAEFLPIFNMEAFVSAGGGITIGAGSPDYAGDLQTLLVMAAYTMVAGALAFYLLHRRDIGGASRG